MTTMGKLLAVLAVSLLVATGCGGDDDEDTEAGDDTSETTAADGGGADEGGGGGDLNITASGFKFEPDTLETEGGTVSVTVTNDDSVTHTFTLDDDGVDEEVPGGEAVTVDVEVPAGGEVTYHCEIHPAMTGTITG
jgi:plastocyanin